MHPERATSGHLSMSSTESQSADRRYVQDMTAALEEVLAKAEHKRTISLDEFLAARVTPPPGVGTVSLEDVDRAIAEGASGRGSI